MKLRSIELLVPRADAAADFLTRQWGMAPAEVRGDTHYLRGSGPHPYLVALTESEAPAVRSVTFACDETELSALSGRVAASELPARPVVSEDPGGGHGLIVELPERRAAARSQQGAGLGTGSAWPGRQRIRLFRRPVRRGRRILDGGREGARRL